MATCVLDQTVAHDDVLYSRISERQLVINVDRYTYVSRVMIRCYVSSLHETNPKTDDLAVDRVRGRILGFAMAIESAFQLGI